MSMRGNGEDAVHRVKEAAQITDIIGECVGLKHSGANLKGLCPFHSEKTPSFMVSPARQSFHCFGCGEGGDVFTFMMKYYNLSFPEALRELAARYRIELPERPGGGGDDNRGRRRRLLYEINEKAAGIFHRLLIREAAGGGARGYLKQRGLPVETIRAFQLGYAPSSWDFLGKQLEAAGFKVETAVEAGLLVRKERGGWYDRFRDRVLFPIQDLAGRVAGFGGRILGEGEPKYLNTPETPVYDKGRLLFGLHQHRDGIRRRRRAVIVEGNFDLLTLAAYGFDNVVAPLGTALTRNQVRTLKGFADEMVLLFDGDDAGRTAAMRAVPHFLAEEAPARIAVLPAGHDPDTYVREAGADGVEKLLDTARPLLDQVFDHLVEKHGRSLEGKGRILAELRPYILALADQPLQQSVLVAQFSERLDLDPDQVWQGFQKAAHSRHQSLFGRSRPEGTAAGRREFRLPQKQRQVLEFLVFYPQYVHRFIEAGVEQVLNEPLARNILARLVEAAGTGGDPETLLELLPEGEEKSYIARMLISAPVYPEGTGGDEPEATAEGMLAWLARDRCRREMCELTRRIEAVQKSGAPETELSALLVRKAEISRELSRIGGDHGAGK